MTAANLQQQILKSNTQFLDRSDFLSNLAAAGVACFSNQAYPDKLVWSKCPSATRPNQIWIEQWIKPKEIPFKYWTAAVTITAKWCPNYRSIHDFSLKAQMNHRELISSCFGCTSLQKVHVILVWPLKCAFPSNMADCTITFHAYAMLTGTKFVTLFPNLVFISGKMRLKYL